MKPVLIFKFPFASSFGGGEHHTIELVNGLREAGANVDFVGSCSVLLKEFRMRQWPARRWWAGKEPVAIWSLALFPFTLVPAWFGLLGLLVWYRFRRQIGTLYCLSLTEKVLCTPVARLLGMRVLWMEHVSPQRWLSKNPLHLLYVVWSRLATVIVVSEHQQGEFVQLGVPAGRLVVVQNGVSLAPYRMVQRRTFHWTKRFLIGTIGRLEEEKGTTFLLQSFHKLLVMVPHARLIIVGEGSQRKSLEWLARQLGIEGAVQFVGFQRDVAGWVASFDCFVLPSVERESFGIVLLEAMAAMCPVIGTNVGGIPNVIQNNRTGILVEPADSELLMGALLYIYQHPDIAMHLAANARRSVEDRFTLSEMLRRLLELFA